MAVLFWGCKKDSNTTEIIPVIPNQPEETDTLPTMVRVVRGITLTPIAGAEVFLFQTDEDGNSILAEHKFTDEEGYCFWSAEDQIKEICARAEDYLGNCDGGNYGSLYDLYDGFMYPKTARAWLKLYVVDDPPTNNQTYVTVSVPFDFPMIQGVSEVHPLVMIRPGDSPYNLHLSVHSTIDDGVIIGLDSMLTAPAFDTLEFVFHY